MAIQTDIRKLVAYGVSAGLVPTEDIVFTTNRLLELFGLDELEDADNSVTMDVSELEEVLGRMCDFAYEKGLMAENTVTYRDLFDTKIMSMLMPRPSEVIHKFWELYEKESPEAATDYYYSLSCDSNYIRRYRVSRDKKWIAPTKYGDLDITINLSKPEKDPKAIAAAKNAKQSGYPKCLLCKENEGYADVAAGVVQWPMSVIRLSGENTGRIIALADRILEKWRSYTDEHPLGVYHPHAKLHHIKKENIGLIEVMGLAVLPARLKDEMAHLKEAMLAGKDLRADEELAKHADWVDEFSTGYEKIDASNIDAIIEKEIGLVFMQVLEDAGVYKRTEEGQKAFDRFLAGL